jgi:hypothetical protein
MNILDRILVEKTAAEHSWENVLESSSSVVLIGSARHQARMRITAGRPPTRWRVETPKGMLQQELSRSFPALAIGDCCFDAEDFDQLSTLLHRAAELAVSLPNQTAAVFVEKVKKEIEGIASFNTEIENLVRQRVGQATFRQALHDYWGGACTVTGIKLPEILLASHAKPWAVCANDEKRLNVFNGLLLTANLDALFDKGMISFVGNGSLICSSRLEADQRSLLQLDSTLKLRWIAPAHDAFLSWHRDKVFVK